MFDFEKILEKVEYNIILGGRNNMRDTKTIINERYGILSTKLTYEQLTNHYKKHGEVVECNDGRASNWYFEEGE